MAAVGQINKSTPPAAYANGADAALPRQEVNTRIKPWAYVPDTVSKEAQEELPKWLVNPALIPAFPAPTDITGWDEMKAGLEESGKQKSDAAVKAYQSTIMTRSMGGTEVVDIRPKDWKDNGQVLVYIHGGAWVFFTAQSSLDFSVLIAHRTGLRLISVNYTRAPQARWPQVMDEIITVMKELMKEGYSLSRIAIVGDSAGGNLAATVTLKMRDLGIGMPAAVVMWSPCTDFTNTADTRITLRNAETAYFYDKHLKNAMLAYADAKDWKNPYVSPVYGDFTKGFPPTLIQVGTREILLSDSVRLYQAIETAGGLAKLDVYEGMIHAFPALIPEAPEGRLALSKVKAFLEKHLGR